MKFLRVCPVMLPSALFSLRYVIIYFRLFNFFPVYFKVEVFDNQSVIDCHRHGGSKMLSCQRAAARFRVKLTLIANIVPRVIVLLSFCGDFSACQPVQNYLLRHVSVVLKGGWGKQNFYLWTNLINEIENHF